MTFRPVSISRDPHDIGWKDSLPLLPTRLFPRRWSESLCFMPSTRVLQLPCKVYVFADGWRRTNMHERIAGMSASLPFRRTLHFVLSQRGCFKSDVYFCNTGKRRATALITQIVSHPGSTLDSSKLGSRLRNEPLVCPWPKTLFWAVSCSTCTVLVYCI